MSQANVVDRLVDQLEAAGIRLSVDERTQRLRCRGRLSRITPAQDAFIRQHCLEVQAAVKARKANWQAAADRKIAAAVDLIRASRDVLAPGCPIMNSFGWEQRLAVVSAATAMQNSLMLDEAIGDLNSYAGGFITSWRDSHDPA